MVSTTPSEPSPQARIRDNQRRSRARRKEYLQELETKYRACEQIGASASTEIQAAARKVADENRRLRVLLQSHGISDPDLSRVQVQDYTDTPVSDDARTLGAMLSTRRACGDADLRQCSAPPASSRLPMPISPISPSDSMRGLAPYPETTPQQTHLYPPTVNPSCGSTCGQSTSTTPLQTSLSPLPQFHIQPDPESYYLPPNDSQHLLNPQDQYQQDQQQNGSSCYAVANMIRSINPHIGGELEAELGCADGRECNVSDLRAFEVLDRVSGA
ncbi:unnamed protein product [Zymoseptoria tritici ST99CH_1E4]|uniref:BZIP domain-containing protein n=1 Tax=Zymoseptoria tritici ST99CH_1E4 TaxID=1276532 RepID=A0A2H1GYR8_ZYMTR|nr:unnamed protein product [Zymoseptoria tritici ST99CH_1E4]